jgi:putative protease
MAEEKEIGKVTHFFPKISVAIIELSGTLKIGDNIAFRGATTDFTQKVDSMQIEHKQVKEAKKGQSIGMKVVDRVREEDTVYRLAE